MTSVFNTPFELGMRMVFLLSTLYPRKVDLQRLVYYDYAAIYSSDLGGPESLHTPVPLRGAEFASRREVIEEGLYMMAIRSFVDVVPDSTGITYGIGENGPALVDILGGVYTKELLRRCQWVADTLGDLTDSDLEQMFLKRGILWGVEFVGTENGSLNQ